jgi:hypothetical protein
MRETPGLTADGASLLRQARDQILAHPEQYDKGLWDCGTSACIAGWICRCANVAPQDPMDSFGTPDLAASLIGVRFRLADGSINMELSPLFLDGHDGPKRLDVQAAAAEINAFLWSYGFPPDALPAVEPARQPAGEEAPATNAVRLSTDQPGVPVRA